MPRIFRRTVSVPRRAGPLPPLALGVLLALGSLSVATFVPPALAAQEAADAPVRYDDDLLPAGFHAGRRAAVLETLPEGAVAVFFSAPHRTRQNDVRYEYRQDSDLLYLTGSHEPGTVLLLAPGGMAVDGERVRELLLVPPRDPAQEVWTGRRLGTAGAEAELGVEKAVALDRLEGVVRPILEGAETVRHLPLPDGVEEGDPLRAQLALLEEVETSRDDRSLRRTLDRLRMTKTAEELALLERTVDITGAALREAIRSIEPGMHEYEVEAVVEYVFKRSGAESPGYPSIVGSGENSVILHYETNRRRMEAGDVVVMDVGAELHGYTADITRTVPVDGTFSPEQRAVYEIVLEAQDSAIAAARAGADFRAPHVAAARVLARGLARLGLIESPTDARGLRRFFMHGTSHYLGLDVHDVGTGGPLVPGTVITVEPGLYVAPAEDVDPRWWNVGVRIEDDVLVTAAGPRVLSDAVPKTVEEIEALMAEEGVGNRPVGAEGGR